MATNEVSSDRQEPRFHVNLSALLMCFEQNARVDGEITKAWVLRGDSRLAKKYAMFAAHAAGLALQFADRIATEGREEIEL